MEYDGFKRCLSLVTVGLMILVSETNGVEESMCLTAELYSAALRCVSPLQIKFDSVEYGVNSNECADACCVSEHVICTQNETTPTSVTDMCDTRTSCVLNSVSDVDSVMITCPGEVQQPAAFAKLHFSCIEVTSPPTQPTTIAPTTRLAQVVTSQSTAVDVTTEDGAGIRDKNTGPTDIQKSDLGLVIGVSVAAGVVIIIIVVVIAVITTRRRKRNNSSNLSQNSTKTLATSDVENGESPETGRSSEDVYGFGAAAQSQRERLQKRNDSIKRNLSIKVEEQKKNKRPSKLSKSKSKSKSQSLDHLNTNNSNSASGKKESRGKGKAKNATSSEKGKTTQKNNTGASNIATATDKSDSKSNQLSI